MRASEEKSRKKFVEKRKRLSGFLFETSLPNEYLVQIGLKSIVPILGGKRFKWFKKFLRVPASVQTIMFSTDNANVDYQGIGIEGYATWRIDPARPEKSMTTLDFFDDDDPMAQTNLELKTICIEAVRHVIANMTIDEALKKKAEIASALKLQLKEVEENWGIIFDQVGIEKVRIMSNSLFEELQSKYRDRLRLDVQKTKMKTDREIAAEQNDMKEKTELETLSTEQKIGLARNESREKTDLDALNSTQRIELARNDSEEKTQLESMESQKRLKLAQNDSKEKTEMEALKSEHTIKLARGQNKTSMEIAEIEERNRIAEKERDVHETAARKDSEFQKEEEQLKYDLHLLEKNLKLQLQDVELKVMDTRRQLEDMNNGMIKERLELEKLKREIKQIHSPETLTSDFINTLPRIFKEVKIDNYSIMDTGGNGSAAAPVSKFIKEILFMLQDSDLSVIKKAVTGESESD